MPTINVSSIEGFNEMTPEQKVEALLKVEIPDNIDLSQYVPKDTADRYATEAANYKKQLREKQTDDEAAEADRKTKFAEMEQKIATLEREKLESTYKASYLAMGYDEQLAESSAKAMAAGDMKTVFENQKKAIDANEKKIKADLMKGTPNPGGHGGKDKDTSEDVEIAKRIGKAKTNAISDSAEVLKHYMK